jgi:O-antigen/teichoic acid export membrane protein
MKCGAAAKLLGRCGGKAMDQSSSSRPSIHALPSDSPERCLGIPSPVTHSNDEMVTSSGSLIRSVVWNLIGDGSPILVAVFAIPILIHSLGNDRFGVLTLAWAMVGYFGIFDVGLGRALTKLIAERKTSGQSGDIPGLIQTGLLLVLLFGAVGTALVAALSPLLIRHVLKVPAPLQHETLYAFYLLAFSIPAGLCLSALRGVLAAFLRFDLINLLRFPFMFFIFLGPLMVLPFSRSLVPIVAVLLGARVVSCAWHLFFCFRLVPELYSPLRIRTTDIIVLLTFGGWVSVSNIVSPLLVYVDRFVIGSFISMEAVAWYVTPYEMVSKLGMIPGAIVMVLFPAFAECLPVAPTRVALLFERGVKYTIIALFPLILFAVTMAHRGLTIWLGADFAAHSTRVLQWVALGVFINSVGHLPYALIQASNRPDITAKLHLIEIPFYLVLLRWLVVVDGVQGAAMVWTLRVAVDTGALLAITGRIYPLVARSIREIFGMLAATTFILLMGIWLPNGSASVIFLIVTLAIFSVIAWSWLLSVEEKTVLRSGLRTIWALP